MTTQQKIMEGMELKTYQSDDFEENNPIIPGSFVLFIKRDFCGGKGSNHVKSKILWTIRHDVTEYLIELINQFTENKNYQIKLEYVGVDIDVLEFERGDEAFMEYDIDVVPNQQNDQQTTLKNITQEIIQYINQRPFMMSVNSDNVLCQTLILSACFSRQYF